MEALAAFAGGIQEECMSDAVKLERAGAIAILRLDDPSTLNALSPAIKEGLAAKVPMLLADATVSAIVLTGTGKAFCAGGDIRAMTDPEGRKAPAVRTRMRAAHSWARALLDCDKPVIAAVNGAAVGGGLALALLAEPAATPTSSAATPGSGRYRT